MFYEQILLTRKGALANIWLAAHWDKKLSKTQVETTNLVKSIESILSQYLALRLSGHLLLGAARIYNKKVYFLFSECNEALLKIRSAFRSAIDIEIDGPASVLTTTLPQNLGDFEITLPQVSMHLDDLDINVEDEEGFSLAAINTKEIIPLRVTTSDISSLSVGQMSGSQNENGIASDGLFGSQVNWYIEHQRRDADLLETEEVVDGFKLFPEPKFDTEEDKKSSMFLIPSGDNEIDVPSLSINENMEIIAPEFTEGSRESSIMDIGIPAFKTPTKVVRKKRALLATLDETTQLSNEQMVDAIQNQLYFHNDEFDLVPLTKRLKKNAEYISLQNTDLAMKAIFDELGLANKILDVIKARESETLKDFRVHGFVQEGGIQTGDLSGLDDSRLDVEDVRRQSNVDHSFGFENIRTEFESFEQQPPMEKSLSVDDQHMSLIFDQPKSPSRSFAPEVEESLLPEDLKLSENTMKVRAHFGRWADETNKIYFLEQCKSHKSTKREVAQAFFGILEMVTKTVATVQQPDPWGEIVVTLKVS